MANNMKIGFWGYPNPEIINKTKLDYPEAEWIDLDIDFEYPKTNILPESYCKIIRNIIDNAIYIKPELILAPIGKDKCDSGWFASKILADMGFNVIQTIFEKLEPKREIVICDSNMPLYDKIGGQQIATVYKHNRVTVKSTKKASGVVWIETEEGFVAGKDEAGNIYFS